jgi:hypothetical protein
MKARRVLAVVCIIVSSVLAAGVPLSFLPQLVPPGDDAGVLPAQVLSGVILAAGVFFSAPSFRSHALRGFRGAE